MVLHPEGGRDRRQGPPAGAGRRAHRGRGPRRPVAKGPQLVSVPECRLEARASHSAGSRPVHHGRSPQVRRRLVLTNRVSKQHAKGEVMNMRKLIVNESPRQLHRPAGRSSRDGPGCGTGAGRLQATGGGYVGDPCLDSEDARRRLQGRSKFRLQLHLRDEGQDKAVIRGEITYHDSGTSIIEVSVDPDDPAPRHCETHRLPGHHRSAATVDEVFGDPPVTSPVRRHSERPCSRAATGPRTPRFPRSGRPVHRSGV